MAQVFNNILLLIVVVLSLGAAVIFTPSLSSVWFREIDAALNAGTFAVMTGVALVAVAVIYAQTEEPNPLEMSSGGEPVQNLKLALFYFVCGLLLAVGLDPFVDVGVMQVTEETPRAIDATVDAQASMVADILHALLAFAFSWVMTIWANVMAFADIAVAVFLMISGVGCLWGAADAARDDETATGATDFADWLGGRPDVEEEDEEEVESFA